MAHSPGVALLHKVRPEGTCDSFCYLHFALFGTHSRHVFFGAKFSLLGFLRDRIRLAVCLDQLMFCTELRDNGLQHGE